MRLPVVVVALLGLTLGTGCSSDEDEPERQEPTSDFARQTTTEIVAAADAAMAQVQSVRVTGTVENADGLTFDARVDRDGNCMAEVELFGGHAQAVEAPSGSYVKGDDTFWANTALNEEEAEIMAEEAAGKWVRSPRKTGVLGTFCDLEQMLKLIGSGEPELAAVGDEAEVGGRTAVAITSEATAGATTTLWIAVDAPHHMLRLETVGGEEPGVFTVSDFDVPVEVELPRARDVIDLEKLAERG